ncbi:cytochrome c [Myxococcus llanfairpwllgwyngyllgogerychwyrndrobwllllantysiliogogogochensis]|uniref:Cytochrome c n=1 Tax=Myxococcus llanfairpwllgwyngyllgogerychwyrndrobwllllantysiliogogogochensis TaxID=2590453 RepID=A0A540WZ54_9BACT|nr:c-type cytochrome [Myxococcus llanfairpwllgwyngyllgogerychwyrndrobwllllantysiliogogogochensis]TQF14250.1 cytochrome c [Myxococcus llanfairpwllgwyngyllgogerychwyrndrobwllllantysiliogogogochensis]
MKHIPLLALLLLPGLAGADDAGKNAFNKVCSGCHTLNPPASQQKQFAKTGAPSPQRQKEERRFELGELVHNRTPEQLRAWLTAPSQVQKNTRCDTRGITPSEVEQVHAYLLLSARPPPPSRDELLRQQLQEDLASRRAKKRPTTPSSSSRPAQGKK